MKTRLFRYTTTTLAGFLCLLTYTKLRGSIVDSFNEAPFDFSGVTIGESVAISGYLGNTLRKVRLGPRLTPAEDTLLGTLNASQGVLIFYSNDTTPSAPNQNLYISMSYRTDTLFDASPYNAFTFDFTDLAGTGDIVIEIGFGPSIYNTTTLSTPITEPGWLAVPMESINYSTSGGDTLNAFKSIHFTFRATSPTFGFTLNEIALTTVPEPASAAVLLGGAVLAAATLRRRRRGNRYTGI